MSKEKSKVQKGIEFIFAHPGARSDALGKVMECEPKNVQAFMGPVLEAGLIVSCKVERPGQQTINEYKPSSAAPDKCPDNWLDWKRANLPPAIKPLRFKATGPRDGLPKSGSARETQAVSGEVTTAAAAECSPLGKQHLPSSEAAIEVQAGSHGPEEVTASTSAPAASAPSGVFTPVVEPGSPYVVELIETRSYSIKVGSFEVDGFSEVSTWNGFTELRNAGGSKLIIVKEEENPIARTMKAFLPPGRNQPLPKATIVTGTPALIKMLFPNLAKAVQP